MKPLAAASRIVFQTQRFFSPIATARARDDCKIVPQWSDTGVVDPLRLSIDCTNYDMSKGPANLPELTKLMRKTFDKVGLVLLRNTGLDPDLGAMGTWAQHLTGSATYEGGANSRGQIAQNVYDVGVPSYLHLPYHHEMASFRESVQYISFCAGKVPKPTLKEPFRGMTFLSQATGVTDDILSTSLGQKLKDKGICAIRCMTDRDTGTSGKVYNHWQTSFNTEDPKEAEEICKGKGLYFAWGPGRFLRTKSYVSAYEYCPAVDRNLVYGSIADHGNFFDTWPEIAELAEMESFETATPDCNPLKMTFGDDSEMTRDELELFSEVYDRHAFPIPYQAGDIAIVCNVRFSHGRPGYTLEPGEERLIGVCLGEMFDRIGQRDGKW